MFDLEKLEKAIIIFLLFTLISGLGIIAYRKTHSNVNLEIKNFRLKDEAAGDMNEFINKARRININEAEIEDLMKLKGIGRVLAERIVDYRLKTGPFRSVSDIKNVKGIGDKLFDSLKDDISIE